jgi:hypothetical protein
LAAPSPQTNAHVAYVAAAAEGGKHSADCEFNPDNPLNLRLGAMFNSQECDLSLKSLVEKDKQLSEFYRTDEKFALFVDRHDDIGAARDVLHAYDLWRLNQMFESSSNSAFFKAGKAEGRDKRDVEIAIKLLAGMNSDAEYAGVETFLRNIDIPMDVINLAWERVKNERTQKN